mgnify:CR=1 FL=1
MDRRAGPRPADGARAVNRLTVLYDDRPKVSPGVKFKDAELIGVPTIVVVGKGLAEGVIEVKDRASGERESRLPELVRAVEHVQTPTELDVDRIDAAKGRGDEAPVGLPDAAAWMAGDNVCSRGHPSMPTKLVTTLCLNIRVTGRRPCSGGTRRSSR